LRDASPTTGGVTAFMIHEFELRYEAATGTVSVEGE